MKIFYYSAAAQFSQLNFPNICIPIDINIIFVPSAAIAGVLLNFLPPLHPVHSDITIK